jgi:hypothetical protein
MTSDVVDRAVECLRRAGVRLTPGLDDREIDHIEAEYELRFAPDHRAFLQAAQPTGDAWTDWRTAPRESLVRTLEWPVEGVLYDVDQNSFWPVSWGVRPRDPDMARAVGRAHLATWPKLVPIYGHRYMPSAPAPSGVPVLSVHQSDVTYYGSDLHNYVTRELWVSPATKLGPIHHPVGAWSALARGATDEDL